jgi:acetylornithine deacetylase/succinyl-diaminopimelate desuccinylase family protein
MVDFACDLVRLNSENPPGRGYAACAEAIAQRLQGLGFGTEVLNPSGMGPCVAGTLGAGGRALYFSGHYDVVPVFEAAQFTPESRNGHLFGRGTADMKGGIASMVCAMQALKAAGVPLNGRLVSMSVPDEETSGPHGTISLVKAGLVERDAIGMLTMEPTSDVVWHANRGVISGEVTVTGKPAHVGLHFRGVNAFRGMLRVAGYYAQLEDEISRRETTHHIEPAAARRSVLLLGGGLSGGHNFNVVPDRVSFSIDRRPNPEEDFDAERARLFDVIARARSEGILCELEIFQEGRSAASDAASPVGRALADAIAVVTGHPAAFELCPGVLETRHYADLGIPSFAYGPGRLEVSHGPHECVSIERMVQCAEVYALVAAQLLA